MQNLAGCDPEEGTKIAREELEAAGITIECFPIGLLPQGEVMIRVFGSLHYWRFERAWYYWIANGPGLSLEYAMPLHELHGREVRVDGHCGCPSPIEWLKGSPVCHYHVDSQVGLRALADAIKRSVMEARVKFGLPPSELEEGRRL